MYNAPSTPNTTNRKIVLDTETTGLDPNRGDRIVEIGCIELIDDKPTGNTFHQYINPMRDVPDEAFKIHGLSSEYLSSYPPFKDIARKFLEYIADSDLIIHNASFDMKFLNAELGWLGLPKISVGRAIDTLKIARNRFPGSKNDLDSLCDRFMIDRTCRTYHGALMDSELLVDVYLELTGANSYEAHNTQEFHNTQEDQESHNTQEAQSMSETLKHSDFSTVRKLKFIRSTDNAALFEYKSTDMWIPNSRFHSVEKNTNPRNGETVEICIHNDFWDSKIQEISKPSEARNYTGGKGDSSDWSEPKTLVYVHCTEKAVLFSHNGKDIWIPRKLVKIMDGKYKNLNFDNVEKKTKISVSIHKQFQNKF